MHTKLILVRHGETDWTRRKKYCGITDIGLSKNGKAQAKKLAERLANEKIDKVYSSDLRRAMQFCKLAAGNTHVEKVPALREMNFGIFKGLTHQEIMKRYPEIYEKWLKDPVKITIPKGESLKSFSGRIIKALSKILSRNKNKTIVVFTHGGPIRVYLCYLKGINLRKIWKIQQNVGCINIIEFKDGKAKIRLLNDTSYLNG